MVVMYCGYCTVLQIWWLSPCVNDWMWMNVVHGEQSRLLYSLTEAGRKELRYLSFTHLRWRSLSLKEQLNAAKIFYNGRETLYISNNIFASILLLSPTTCSEWRGHPRIEIVSGQNLYQLLISFLIPSKLRHWPWLVQFAWVSSL